MKWSMCILVTSINKTLKHKEEDLCKKINVSKVARCFDNFMSSYYSFFLFQLEIVNISSQEMQQFYSTFVPLLLNFTATTTIWAL